MNSPYSVPILHNNHPLSLPTKAGIVALTLSLLDKGLEGARCP